MRETLQYFPTKRTKWKRHIKLSQLYVSGEHILCKSSPIYQRQSEDWSLLDASPYLQFVPAVDLRKESKSTLIKGVAYCI